MMIPTVTMTRGCSYCKGRGMRIDSIVSIYQHLCKGQKGLKQETVKPTEIEVCQTVTMG